MLRNLVAAALLGLTVSASAAVAQYGPAGPYHPGPYGTGARPFASRPSYHVQFRQPEWREQVFDDPYALDEFVQDKKSNGWEVRVIRSGYDQHRVQYRLRNWGGSRFLPSMWEARQWAQELEATQGLQTRIVPYGPR